MNPRSLKRFLVGAVAAGVAAPGLAMAEPTCVYVIGQVNSQTVTTPAVAVVVPDSGTEFQPVRVHLDEGEQVILGYSARVPGADASTEGQMVFLPGVAQHIPSISSTLQGLTLTPSRCINVDSTSTPAVPVHIPASVLTLPGAIAQVGAILINIVGHPVTVPGNVIIFDGKQIVIPERDSAVPGVPVGTPNESITFDANGTVTSAHYLAPPTN